MSAPLTAQAMSRNFTIKISPLVKSISGSPGFVPSRLLKCRRGAGIQPTSCFAFSERSRQRAGLRVSDRRKEENPLIAFAPAVRFLGFAAEPTHPGRLIARLRGIRDIVPVVLAHARSQFRAVETGVFHTQSAAR